ncbi:hypothetical protein CYMTET_24896 [Cymbomonas tetramitiformis]|uniref:PROP1-like PPR domain-containing protein n=1 Tax=Cymbomonas tetramitiformis TaxID=36881 RepID=A0AAE0KZL3_9CHLO|nr:hypothetical protein CYMTET_24896 [Cymbomonas tetramitiformis]
MEAKGIPADASTWAVLISAAGTMGGMEGAFRERVRMRVEAPEIVPTPAVFAALIKTCAKAGDLEGAAKVLKDMQRERVDMGRLPLEAAMAHNALLQAYVEAGEDELAVRLASSMVDAMLSIETKLYDSVLDMAWRRGERWEALELVKTALDNCAFYNYAVLRYVEINTSPDTPLRMKLRSCSVGAAAAQIALLLGLLEGSVHSAKQLPTGGIRERLEIGIGQDSGARALKQGVKAVLDEFEIPGVEDTPDGLAISLYEVYQWLLAEKSSVKGPVSERICNTPTDL